METNFITKYIPKGVLDKIEKVLLKIAGDPTGKTSIFQKAYDAIRGIKPNEKFLRVMIALISYLFKIPALSELLLDAYNRARTLQVFVDAGSLTPEAAQQQLRDEVTKTTIAQALNLPSYIINAMSELVILAIKIRY